MEDPGALRQAQDGGSVIGCQLSERVVVVLTSVAGISWDLVQVYDVCNRKDY